MGTVLTYRDLNSSILARHQRIPITAIKQKTKHVVLILTDGKLKKKITTLRTNKPINNATPFRYSIYF